MESRTRGGPGAPKRTRRARGAPAADPRLRLLDVALNLFARHGFDGVSTNMIAAEAGLSQPMVYYHFRSKEDLWQRAIDALMRDLGRRYPRSGEELKDLDPAAQLNVMTRRFIQMSVGDPRLSQIVILESLARSERLDWMVRAYLKSGFADFDTAIRNGIEKGQIKDLPLHVISNTLVAASSLTFCVAPLVEKGYGVDVRQPARFREAADAIVEILFNGLLAKPRG